MSLGLEIREQSRIMIFAPHPDDESLGAGGLLQIATATGAAVKVVFATDGDNNPWPQRALEKRWRIRPEDCIRWGKRRREEALLALSILGVGPDKCVFLGYPDQGITELLIGRESAPVERINSEISRFQPDLIVVPSEFDAHPDHSAFGLLVRFACLESSDCTTIGMLHYLIHTRSTLESQASGEVELPLSPEQQKRKRRAIFCHATQMKLGRRRLLKLARRSEKFSMDTEAMESNPQHPVRKARVTGKYLRLSLKSRNYLGAFGQRSLFCVGLLQNGSRIAYYATLPSKSGEAALRDSLSNELLATCSYQGDGAVGELNLPQIGMGFLKKLFVKVERRFGFFDEAGWREVPLPDRV